MLNEYITDQLIPYIGNKRKLLSLIGRALKGSGLQEGTFLDLFAGSTAVARYAKTLGFRVLANDWEPYSHQIALAYIKQNEPPKFRSLGGIDRAFAALNALQPIKGYIAQHYCPEDDEHYNPDTERMFYTQENGQRIDAIREQIVCWKNEGLLDEAEEAILLSSLIFQCAYCSNTSGVFKGFHRGWGGATKTAWYRIRSTLTLRPPLFFDNRQVNLVYREDANKLADDIECDIAYVDPPYNQHQYGANYHLLNTVVLWDKPEINSVFEPRHDQNGKSAIRRDWRTERRSLYCYKDTAAATFRELVGKLKTKHILVSYSTDGLIPIEILFNILAERGSLSIVTQKYKRYRVSSQRPSHRPHNIEFVAVVDTTKPATSESIEIAIEKVIGNHHEWLSYDQ